MTRTLDEIRGIVDGWPIKERVNRFEVQAVCNDLLTLATEQAAEMLPDVPDAERERLADVAESEAAMWSEPLDKMGAAIKRDLLAIAALLRTPVAVNEKMEKALRFIASKPCFAAQGNATCGLGNQDPEEWCLVCTARRAIAAAEAAKGEKGLTQVGHDVSDVDDLIRAMEASSYWGKSKNDDYVTLSAVRSIITEWAAKRADLTRRLAQALASGHSFEGERVGECLACTMLAEARAAGLISEAAEAAKGGGG